MGVPYYRSRRHTAARSGAEAVPAALAGVGEPTAAAAAPAYPVAAVPTTAADVVAWIDAGFDNTDRRSRAAAAHAAEADRSSQRKTVLDAVARVLG